MAAELKLVRTEAEDTLIAQFADSKAKRAVEGLRKREAAFDVIARNGLPNRRVEEWKYTDLRAALKQPAAPAPQPSVEDMAHALASAEPFPLEQALTLSFVNGWKTGEMNSLLQGLSLEISSSAEGISKALPETANSNAAVALNTAFASESFTIRVAAHTAVETPLLLRFIQMGDAPFASYPRFQVIVEEGASFTLIEEHQGPDHLAYQTNALFGVEIGKGATFHHVRLNQEGSKALVLSTLAAHLDAHAELVTTQLVSGGALSRHQVYLTFAGENAKAELASATMIKGDQHADTTLIVDHAVPHGTSRELFKTVIDDEATGVFQGKIIVRPGAQKTDGRMMSASLLLGEQASMNNKPELEIFADDVQCAHGATCGSIDEELLFYLRARGLPHNEAVNLLVQAFLGEALESVQHDGVRDLLQAKAQGWLSRRTHPDGKTLEREV